jgi:hypothetical protein
MIRILDESGEDYLFTASQFEVVEFPQALRRKLLALQKAGEHLNAADAPREACRRAADSETLDGSKAQGLNGMLTAVLLLVVPLAGEPGAMVPPIEFEVGQVWRYATRPGEDASTLTILRIDRPTGAQPTVHIAVSGLHVKNPHAPGGFTSEIKHLPMDEAALRSSVTTVSRKTARVPDVSQGYKQWQEAKGGAFTVGVAEAVTLAEEAMNR